MNPESIERRLDDIDNVTSSVVAGDGRSHLVAIIVCASGLSEEQQRNVRSEVSALGRALPAHERIGNVLLLDEKTDIDAEFYTRSGKVRRTVILDRFSSELDALYERKTS